MTKRDLWAIWDPEKATEQMKTESPLMESCETVANWMIGDHAEIASRIVSIYLPDPQRVDFQAIIEEP